MAVTFGFYNSKNGDRVYDAHQMSSIFSGIIQDGVFEHFPGENQHFHVEWLNSQMGNKVVVGPGRAWFNDTWTDNDANLTLTIDPPNVDPTIDRIDAIVLEINTTNNVDTISNVPGRTNAFIVVRGTEANYNDVVKPNLRNGNGIYQYYIALVRASQTADRHYISNMVGSTTPYIIGAVQSVSTADVLQNWTQRFNQEIDRLVEYARSTAESAVQAYFDDPDSAIYQDVNRIDENVNQLRSDHNIEIGHLKIRQRVWLCLAEINPNNGYYEAFTPDTAVRFLYPDFLSTEYDDDLPSWVKNGRIEARMPQPGDIVIGRNGYYGYIHRFGLTSGGNSAYTMVVISTGRTVFNTSGLNTAITNAATAAASAETIAQEAYDYVVDSCEPKHLDIVFSGGHDFDGNDISADHPVTCSMTFQEIIAAVYDFIHDNVSDADVKPVGINVMMNYTNNDIASRITTNRTAIGSFEYTTETGSSTTETVTSFSARFTTMSSNNTLVVHSYTITADGITNSVSVI